MTIPADIIYVRPTFLLPLSRYSPLTQIEYKHERAGHDNSSKVLPVTGPLSTFDIVDHVFSSEDQPIAKK